MTRASSLYFFAQAIELAEGLIVARSTMRPSALETILCLTTRMSPGSNASLCCRSDCSSLSASESPGLISPATGIGMIRRSSRASADLFVSPLSRLAFRSTTARSAHRPSASCGQKRSVECPPANQALGAGFAGMCEKPLQVFGIVHVECDAGQLQHDAGFARGLGGGEVRFEAVVAEAQGKKIRRAAEGGVGAASIGGGRQHRAFRGSAGQNLVEFAGLNQRNVGGDDQRAVACRATTQKRVAISMAPVSPGFAGSGMISKSYCRASSSANGSLVTRAQAGRRVHASKCGHNVMQHGLRQFGARRLIEHGGEPLLGRRQILDGNENHGWSAAVRAAALSETGSSRDRLPRNAVR